MKSNSIDIVYTWVDDTDKKWLKKKEAFLNSYSGKLFKKSLTGRFEDHQELKYSLRSVEQFMPWIRHIYIITDKQIPSWLKRNDKLTIVDHSDIFPKSVVKPVFNSLLIELFIHKIDGLSENYLYFNDDFIINKPLKENDFFTTDGKCVRYITTPIKKKSEILLESASFEKRFFNKIEKIFVNREVECPFYTNTFDLFHSLNKEYKKIFHLKHVPYAYKKSTVEQIFSKYEPILKRMYFNQFRSKNDLMLAYLIVLEEFKKNNASYSCDNNDLLEFILGKHQQTIQQKSFINIFDNKYKFLHFADGEPSDPIFVNKMNTVLLTKFPNKSSFETTNNKDVVDPKILNNEIETFVNEMKNKINFLENKINIVSEESKKISNKKIEINIKKLETEYDDFSKIKKRLIEEVDSNRINLEKITNSKFYKMWQNFNKVFKEKR